MSTRGDSNVCINMNLDVDVSSELKLNSIALVDRDQFCLFIDPAQIPFFEFHIHQQVVYD